MHKKIFLTLLLALPFFAITKAQKNKKDSTVVIFFNENKSERTERKKTGEANIIKIAPLGFVSGTYPILFERVITNFFTVQVGGGLTGKNFWRSAINKTGENSSIKMTYPWEDDSQYDKADGLFNYDTRTTAMGYMFTVQPRLYFESEAPDGSFLGVSYDYYNYKFSIPALLLNNSSGSAEHKGAAQSEHENISDIMVHFGYQSVYDRLTLEYTTGIGIRNVKGTKYAGYNDFNTGKIIDGFATYKQSVFNFGIGIKVGYHF